MDKRIVSGAGWKENVVSYSPGLDRMEFLTVELPSYTVESLLDEMGIFLHHPFRQRARQLPLSRPVELIYPLLNFRHIGAFTWTQAVLKFRRQVKIEANRHKVDEHGVW